MSTTKAPKHYLQSEQTIYAYGYNADAALIYERVYVGISQQQISDLVEFAKLDGSVVALTWSGHCNRYRIWNEVTIQVENRATFQHLDTLLDMG